MKCGDCQYYEPHRNPATGRQMPSQKGDCIYPVEWPALPKSFVPDGWYKRIEYPRRDRVWKNDDHPCLMFVERPQNKKLAAQMSLEGLK